MENKAILALLCGLPGSGKTYLSTCIADKLVNGLLLGEMGKVECLVVCYDDLMPFVDYDKYSESLPEFTGSSKWKIDRKSARQTVEMVVATVKGHPDLEMGCQAPKQVENFLKKLQNFEGLQRPPVIFLIDDNMHLKSMRFEYFQLARKYNIGYCQMYVKCKPEVAVIRNASRAERVPDPVIHAMAERFEAPQPQNNSWERLSLVIEGDADRFGSWWPDLESLLQDAFHNPVPPLEDHEDEKSLSRETCLASVLHQADQALRKLLSEAMQNRADDEDPKHLSFRLNAARQHVLTGIKAGEIRIPTDILVEVESGNVPKILPQWKLFLKEEMHRRL